MEGDGFVAVRSVEAPRAGKQPPQLAERGQRRGQPRMRQDRALDEVRRATDDEWIDREPVIAT